MTNLSEVALVAQILQRLEDISDDASLRKTEVRTHGRSRADVMFLRGGELVSIEAKVSDWKRAIAQASLNRCCVDRSYIALWERQVTKLVLLEAKRFHIGVIAVSDLTLRVARAAPKANPAPRLRRDIVHAILESA